MKHRRLQELDHSDFGIVDGEPDIRGWDVKLSSGQKVGEVEDLIIDAQKRKVRYMIVDLDDNKLDLKEDKVLIPIGLANLDQNDDDVILPNITVEQLRGLPAYDSDHFDENIEHLTCTTLGRNEGNTSSSNTALSHTDNEQRRKARINEHDDNFYQNDYFNDDNLYKNRLHEAQPASNDSDYQRGLRLWEMRSEGGMIAGSNSSNDTSREDENDRNLSADRRMEMIRNRRQSYEDRRGYRHDQTDDRHRDADHDHERRHRQDNSISARIDREGLRDASH